MNAIICPRCLADNHPSREECRYCEARLPCDDWEDWEDEAEEWDDDALLEAYYGDGDDGAEDAELMRLDSARDRGFRTLQEERRADQREGVA